MAKRAVVALPAGSLGEIFAWSSHFLKPAPLLIVLLLEVFPHVTVLPPLSTVGAHRVVGGDVELVGVVLGLLLVLVNHQGALRARQDGVLVNLHVLVQFIPAGEKFLADAALWLGVFLFYMLL